MTNPEFEKALQEILGDAIEYLKCPDCKVDTILCPHCGQALCPECGEKGKEGKNGD